MPSRHLDPEQARRYAEHRYEYNKKSLAGRVVLLPGGAGGLGAAADGAVDAAVVELGRRAAIRADEELADMVSVGMGAADECVVAGDAVHRADEGARASAHDAGPESSLGDVGHKTLSVMPMLRKYRPRADPRQDRGES